MFSLMSENILLIPGTENRWKGKREVAVVTDNGAIGEVLSTGLFVADARQREILEAEFRPRLILDL